jgi:hypothetical protein
MKENTRRVSLRSLPTIPILFLALVCSFLYLRNSPDSVLAPDSVLERSFSFEPDGGDCQAFNGPRRPPWARPLKMRDTIPQFAKLYAKRPFKDNKGGMKFDHSFALWYTLRSLSPPPTTVIESGAFHGHSAWLIKQTLPDARIISLDPAAPKKILPRVEYMTAKDFVDFAKVDWKAKGVDARKTLVFLDDHQSSFRRIFREGHHQGFLRYIIEDNDPYPKGDNLGMKWVCERERKDAWPGAVLDDFARKTTPHTWEEHIKQGEEAERKTQFYYEFPPIAHENFTKQTRYDSKYASHAIVQTESDFNKLVPKLPLGEFGIYNHFSYVELKEDAR